MDSIKVDVNDDYVNEEAFPDKYNGGSTLSIDSLSKYVDLLEELGQKPGNAYETDERFRIDNTQKALRESEEKIRRIYDNSNDGIAVVDLDNTVVEVNRKLLDISGLPSDSELLGKNFLDFVVTRDRQRIEAAIKQLLSCEKLTGVECNTIRSDGTEISIEVNASVLKDIFGNPTGLLFAMQDITRRKQAEEKNIQGTEKLVRVMDEIIEAMARMVEIRDPYTAGHQRRVSEIAAAIAQEMGLPQDKVEATRVAGMVHDIGKIYVPAEILSKPAHLNEMEYRMIKQHPRLSYEILGSIEFPWPVADIVFQHHERMDGSGYPAGISGEDISIEARIIAVADVVEAMGSHRPYRPSLGIKQALEEISKNKGVLYDPKVVDASLRLLTDKESLDLEQIK
jgi:PAS domain S-box-containing protein/putative nucleotidyltransferase with HDIG domain